MNVFQAAQPALLYIVPAVLGAVGGHAGIRGDFSAVWSFTEAKEPEAAEGAEVKDGATAKAADAVASTKKES
jgi:minor histocompatibility antigen H13